MNIIVSEFAEIQLMNSSEDTRRRVEHWIDKLKRWESDSYVQQHSKKLDLPDNTYMLITDTDLRIFFTLEKDTITVFDVAKKSTIMAFSQTSDAGEP